MFGSKEKIGHSLSIFIIVLAVILAGYVFWYTTKNPRTDDAYIWAETITVSPEVSGSVKEIFIENNQLVQKGQLLFSLNSEIYELKVAQAKSQLATLEEQLLLANEAQNSSVQTNYGSLISIEKALVNLKLANEHLVRQEILNEQGLVTKESVQEAQKNKKEAELVYQRALASGTKNKKETDTGRNTLEAQLETARIDLKAAQKRLKDTQIIAPFDGKVGNIKIAVGEYVNIAQPVFTLINTNNWYVIANFRETELKNIQPNDPVTVYVMTNNNHPLKGIVQSIDWGVLPETYKTDEIGLPRVSRSLNWVRVAQKFPVRILIKDPPLELMRVGGSASVIIHPEK
ncbi:biotin/lipoyl-binding protein [Desulfovibrio litoralis]|uniref:Membrane fusion protein, multidrug efflux system n=1 Tax=Desulfovibrio litoralis DSM 11393 TaxID=1121455 RepID=A0A1M7T4F9_9BACT|nr:biotin/lipoyl-binding protein [Desulfovibrio litoralis]SHN65567.1 membrane fusion protein, multidrug efflux system [Desulfovibrio litoralis DSM 11393]